MVLRLAYFRQESSYSSEISTDYQNEIGHTIESGNIYHNFIPDNDMALQS